MHRPSKLFSVSSFHSISLVPPVFPSFISLDASFSSCFLLISFCLNLVVCLPFRPLHSSLCPSIVPHPLCCSTFSSLLSLLSHISLALPFYLSISPPNSWFKDYFSQPSTSGGKGQGFTGAWTRFVAVCLWSKALSNVKAHPSVIHNLLQSLENTLCGYSA